MISHNIPYIFPCTIRLLITYHGLLLHLQCRRPSGDPLCRQRQIRKSASPVYSRLSSMRRLTRPSIDEELIKYGWEEDVWYHGLVDSLDRSAFADQYLRTGYVYISPFPLQPSLLRNKFLITIPNTLRRDSTATHRLITRQLSSTLSVSSSTSTTSPARTSTSASAKGRNGTSCPKPWWRTAHS